MLFLYWMYNISQEMAHWNNYKSTTMSEKESKVRFDKLIKPKVITRETTTKKISFVPECMLSPW